MRELREERQGPGGQLEDQVIQEEMQAPRGNYHADGPIPPVSEETGFDHPRTAGALAFGSDEEARVEAGPERTNLHPRTLPGKYGDYLVQFAPVKVTKDGEKHDAIKINIKMTPKANVTARQVGYIQVTRLSEDGGRTWATQKSQAMSDQRVKRTDKKTGFRVDRGEDDKTAVYGTSKSDDGGLKATDNAKLGNPGGAEMTDRPWVLPSKHAEFISTATDTTTGQQFDAISWGYKADATHVEAIEPSIIDTYDERLAGRDRAIHQWNDKIATEDGSIAKAPIDFDPVEAAGMLKQNLEGGNKDFLKMTLENPSNRTPEHIKKIKVQYQMETGKALASDLKNVLDDKDEKKFKDWL